MENSDYETIFIKAESVCENGDIPKETDFEDNIIKKEVNFKDKDSLKMTRNVGSERKKKMNTENIKTDSYNKDIKKEEKTVDHEEVSFDDVEVKEEELNAMDHEDAVTGTNFFTLTQNMTCWSSEEDALLIEFVKNNEMLYNVKSKGHRQAHLKQNLWCEIGGTLNKTDVACSKRWAYVRDYYIRRRRKFDIGSSGEAAKKRSVLLSFLDGFSSSKRSTVTNVVGDENSEDISFNESVATEDTNVDNEECDITQHEELLEEGENENIHNERRKDLNNAQPPKKRKMTSQFEKRLHLLKQIAKRKSTSSQDQFDETDHFFMSMAKIVKKLPRYEQAQLRMQISTLVGNAELKHFSIQSE